MFSGLLLTRLRRPIGKMTVTEQRYEGEYRYVNSRLITNRCVWDSISLPGCLSPDVFYEGCVIYVYCFSEEIAFYNGNRREKQTINGTFQKLVSKIKIVLISIN